MTKPLSRPLLTRLSAVKKKETLYKNIFFHY